LFLLVEGAHWQEAITRWVRCYLSVCA
jgi:hypothetical protein